jgi:SAM-dependent methyltransferase
MEVPVRMTDEKSTQDAFRSLTEATKAMWSLGDYRELATQLQPHAQALVEAMGIEAGMSVLDVAAGNGNLALAAARRGARVTASDLTPQMVAWGRERSSAEGLDIEWLEADAEALPFEGDRFDAVASAFGAIFAPRPDRVTAELFRVVKPGGTVGMANWTANGPLSAFMALSAEYAPPPPVKIPSPLSWGDPDEVRGRLGPHSARVDTEPRLARFEFDTLEAGRDSWVRNNGPYIALRNSLSADRARELDQRSLRMLQELNRATDGRLVIESEYLLVVARKRRSGE